MHDDVAPSPAAWPTLAPGEVHLWSFRLARPPAEVARLSRLLSADERERVARFRFDEHRREAVAARGLLRVILGRYLECRPETLVFEYGPYGKPLLASRALHFNLSHSGGVALCGVTLDRPLGVDVERIRADLDHAALGRASFSPCEQAALASHWRERGIEGFFRCWTFKEAYLKGRGGGLSIPLDSFDVPLIAGEADAPVRSREAAPDAAGWFVRDLKLLPGFAAALAIQTRACRVRHWRWPEPAVATSTSV